MCASITEKQQAHSTGRPIALFLHANAWMREQVRRAAPPSFDVRFADPADAHTLSILLPEADFLVTDDVPVAWMPLLSKNCKLVQLTGVGFDGVAVDVLHAAKIPLAATPEGTVVGVAEHTILLILALSKQIVQVHRSVSSGEFDTIAWRANSHFFCGRTLGLVGLGRIGKRVAHLARAFDVRVLYSDVLRAPEQKEKELGLTYCSLDELLHAADIVSVHTPLTPGTAGLFSAERFAHMKQNALFINTGRGGTYDMDALCAALQSGHLGGAGLDVYNPEPPPPNHPILKLPNVICTPHMATGTVEAHQQKAAGQFANFERVLRGETPNNIVTPERSN